MGKRGFWESKEWRQTNLFIRSDAPHTPYIKMHITMKCFMSIALLFWTSVGYSTCHWCHVMERESFEDEEIGKILSDNFVCIKLDREERPDVDKVYMTFVQVCSHLDFSQRPLLLFFSLILSHGCCVLMSTGNKWRWRLAHECVVDPWPSTFYWRHLLPSQRPWKKTWAQNSSH